LGQGWEKVNVAMIVFRKVEHAVFSILSGLPHGNNAIKLFPNLKEKKE
jgi:hypothetical protein